MSQVMITFYQLPNWGKQKYPYNLGVLYNEKL